MAKSAYTVEATSRNVTTVRMSTNSVAGWEQWFLLRSDAHHDNLHADWSLEKKHLEQAKERNAGIFDGGDCLCLMQGKWDKRADPEQLRPEHRGANYSDLVINTATDFYEPYAKNWIAFGTGNHENEFLKRHSTNMTERLVQALNTKTNSHILYTGYSSWVRFMVSRQSQRASFRLWQHHGYGGGGAVTRGVIQTNRMAVYLPDAHIVWSGHTHDDLCVSISRLRLSDVGVPYKDEQVHVRTAGYKDDYADGFGGWQVERGGPPKPRGAAWLRFYWEDGFKYEVQRAT